jgi:peptide/nickel transport system substrate-binding protein
VLRVQSGQADVAYNASPQELEVPQGRGLHHRDAALSRFRQRLAINTKLAPYDDVKVRQALQAGINRQEIIDTVYTPDWKLATSFIQSNVPGATDHSDLLAYNPGRPKSCSTRRAG